MTGSNRSLPRRRAASSPGPQGKGWSDAHEAHWMMVHRPEISFRCGPLAIKNIATLEKVPVKLFPLIEACKSTKQGYVALDLERAGKQHWPELPGGEEVAGRPDHPARGGSLEIGPLRRAAAPVRGPDRASGPDLWRPAFHHPEGFGCRSQRVLSRAPRGPLPKGWQPVSAKEAEGVWGKGTGPTRPPDCGCGDDTSGGDGGACSGCMIAMPRYTMHTMLVSLYVRDTPLPFPQPLGPALGFFDLLYAAGHASGLYGLYRLHGDERLY